MKNAKKATKDILFSDRKSKQKAIAKRYDHYLTGTILDVGADEGYLSSHLSSKAHYTGIGLGGKNPDIIELDLEKDPLLFEEHSFNCVLCLDVLEHLDNLHDVLSHLFILSNKYIIISLPNPWRSFILSLRRKYNDQHALKFYGLPDQKPSDRHKWFFPPSEAKSLISSFAFKNHFSIVEYHLDNSMENDPSIIRKLFKKNIQLFLRLFLRSDLSLDDLWGGTSWWVLKKDS